MSKLEQTRQAALADIRFDMQAENNRVVWLEDQVRDAEMRGDREDAAEMRRQLSESMATLGKLHDLLDWCERRGQ